MFNIRIGFTYILIFMAFCLSLFTPYSYGAERVVKVAILPWELHAPQELTYLKDALYDLTSSRLGAEEDMAIIDSSLVRESLKGFKGSEITESILKEIGSDLGADYVFKGSLSLVGDTLSLDVKVVKVRGDRVPIFSVSQGKGLDSLIPLVGRMSLDISEKILKVEGLTPKIAGFGSTPQYVGRFKDTGIKKEEVGGTSEEFLIVSRGIKGGERIWKSKIFSTLIKGVAIGDVDGDHRNEIVVIDDHKIWIYRRVGDTLELLLQEEGGIGLKNIYVDIGDINGNGIPEIYLTRYRDSRLDSVVYEYDGDGYKKIGDDLRWFLRIIRSDSKPILIGQRSRGKVVFSGDVKRLEWSGGELKDVESLDLPRGIDIYGFNYITQNGKKSLATIDDSDRLRVFVKDKGWKEVWKSKGFFDGSLNSIIFSTGASDVTANPDNIHPVYVKGRILFEDLNNDGKKEVIVRRNISNLSRFLERLKAYKEGEIVDLEWDGISLEENWRTKRLDGYVADYEIGDIDNDGGKDLVIVLVTDIGLINKNAKSTILSYKLLTR